MEFRDTYTKTIAQKKEALTRVQREYKDTLATGIAERNWVTLFRQYENIDELNRRVLMALVDKIIVHENHVVEIFYKYRDEYEQAAAYAASFDDERKNVG
jgi:site-specific DNA recombinase